MRGIISAAGCLPYWQLQDVSCSQGRSTSPGSGTVASYDEDTTTLAVEAGRLALKGTTAEPETLWFATSTPTYAEKTNATVDPRRCDSRRRRFDSGSAVRSGVGALRRPPVVGVCRPRDRRRHPHGPGELAGRVGQAATPAPRSRG